VSATKQAGEPDHAGDPGGASIWYLWVAPANGSLSLDTSGSGFDTVLAVYTGTSVDALTETGSDIGVVTGHAASAVTADVVAGTVYRIAVDGYGGATGAVRVNWSFRISTSTSVRLSTARTTRSHYVTITGAVRPGRAGEAVRIEILKPGSRAWVRVATRTTNASGGWSSYRYKVTLRGTYQLRARFLGDTLSAASTSGSARLTVR
jgi:hypothetical protein